MIKILRFIVFLICLLPSTVYAALRVDITQGKIEPIPVAIADFQGSFGAEVAAIIRNDLESCGLFRIIDNEAFLENLSFDVNPTYSSWRKLQATLIVAGEMKQSAAGIRIEFKVWDPYTEMMVVSKAYTALSSGWRRASHKIADEIYKYITKEAGFFDTRILFIEETGSAKKRVKRLAIADYDGANYKVLTDGRSMALSPSFDSKSQRAIYVSYYQKTPRIFLLDIVTGKQRQLTLVPGIVFAPKISPDGEHVIFSLAKNGTTSLQEANIIGGNVRSILYEPGAISTSPSYSPDGKYIVFNSDRSGSRQLYVMNRDGSNIRRISHGSGVYASPTWSPRGDYIAFVKNAGGVFYLGVMKADGSGERMISSGWIIDHPSWAPNGAAVIFEKIRDKYDETHIYMIDISGYYERLVPTTTAASEPTWSSLLSYRAD